MSKFKVGDKVRVLPRLEGQSNTYPYYSDEMTEFAGKETVIRGKLRGGEWFELDNSEYSWHEEWLELVDKPFTQEDLDVGMLIEYLDNTVVKLITEWDVFYARMNENVVAIYKPIETGFERVWSKPKPKLYTLELPKNTGMTRFYNLIGDEDYGFDNDHNSSLCKTQFTQEEIDNLPNQDLIMVLVKKEVVK